jgi:hypothetical protein
LSVGGKRQYKDEKGEYCSEDGTAAVGPFALFLLYGEVLEGEDVV